ncbi:MAG: hypothetical protein RL299_226 [Pseudomonadota bacterium]|jgi:hypothetical protein
MVVERITPRDRAAWLKARGRDVTASTVGALFGVHEFTTLYELWALKTGRIKDGMEESAPMRRGRLLEPVAAQIMREDFPDWDIHHNAAENVYYRDPEKRIGATPDFIVTCPRRGRGVVQVKSVEQGVYRRKWITEDGEPEAPLWIALQATLEAHLVGARWAAVAPLVIGFGIDMPVIDIPLVPGMIEAIEDETAAFWAMVEEDREPTADYARDADLIDRLHPYNDPGHEVDLTADNRIPDLIDARRRAQEQRRAADAAISEIDAEVKSKMCAATVAHIAGGQRITWRTQKRAAFTSPASTFRTLSYPKPF